MMAAGLGCGDQVIHGELERAFAELLGQLIQLLAGAIQLQQQGPQETGVFDHHWLLFAPAATAGGTG